jgi:hypothetical protein
VRQATAWHVLNADDAQIVEEDTEGQQERDLALFRRWHRGRGTDPVAALEDLRRRARRHALDLVRENTRRAVRRALPQNADQPDPDPG